MLDTRKVKINYIEEKLKQIQEIHGLIYEIGQKENLQILEELNKKGYFEDLELVNELFISLFNEIELKPLKFHIFYEFIKTILQTIPNLDKICIHCAFLPKSDAIASIKIPSFLIIHQIYKDEIISFDLIIDEISSISINFPNHLFLIYYIFYDELMSFSIDQLNKMDSFLKYHMNSDFAPFVLDPEFSKLLIQENFAEKRLNLSVYTAFEQSELLSIIKDDNDILFDEYKNKENMKLIRPFAPKNDLDNPNAILLNIRRFNLFPLQNATEITDIITYSGAVKCMSIVLKSENEFNKSGKEQFFLMANGSQEMFSLFEQFKISFAECLSYAAFYHQYELFDEIIQNYRLTIPNLIHELNETIIACAKSDNIITCKKAFNMRGKFTYLDKKSRSAISYACEYGSINIFKLALAVSPEMLLQQDLEGKSPLHYAVISSNYKIVKELLSLSYPLVDILDRQGRKPEYYIQQDPNYITVTDQLMYQLFHPDLKEE